MEEQAFDPTAPENILVRFRNALDTEPKRVKKQLERDIKAEKSRKRNALRRGLEVVVQREENLKKAQAARRAAKKGGVNE